jgi:hypothetical protein
MKYGQSITLALLLAGLAGLPGVPARAADGFAGEDLPAADAPPTPAPNEPPPPMPAAPQASAAKAAPPGQWTYTQQYGWVWMPYGDRFTSAPDAGEQPYMYVYGPAMGWCWVSAPWIWGWGPVPFFGVVGPWRFGWWGHGYGHWYGFRGPHRSWGWRGYPRGGWGPRPGTYWHPYRR